jgi:hypothetical protein
MDTTFHPASCVGAKIGGCLAGRTRSAECDDMEGSERGDESVVHVIGDENSGARVLKSLAL